MEASKVVELPVSYQETGAFSEVPPSQNGHDAPIELSEEHFKPESFWHVVENLDHRLKSFVGLPKEIRRETVEVVSLFRRELWREKITEQLIKERQAVDQVNRRHFASFKRNWLTIGDTSDDGSYKVAVMRHEGTERPELAIVGSPGWFGRYESFAEQAYSPYLRKFSQIYYNRPGTDRQSVGFLRREGYHLKDHLPQNADTLIAVLDQAVDNGHEEFTLVGHSMGGIVTQVALEKMMAERPDLMGRVRAVFLNNTSSELNIVRHSFLDIMPGMPKMVKAGAGLAERVVRYTAEGADDLYGRLPEEAKQRIRDYTPRQITRAVMSTAYVEKMVGGIDTDVFNASRARAKQNDFLAMLLDGASMLDMPPRENLAKLDVPVFVIEGRDDKLLKSKASRNLADLFAEEKLAEHKVRQFTFEAGHCTQMEDPKHFNSLLYKACRDPEAVLQSYGSEENFRLHQVAKSKV